MLIYGYMNLVLSLITTELCVFVLFRLHFIFLLSLKGIEAT